MNRFNFLSVVFAICLLALCSCAPKAQSVQPAQNGLCYPHCSGNELRYEMSREDMIRSTIADGLGLIECIFIPIP